MRLDDFVLAVFQDNKKPEELDGFERCADLKQIETLMEAHGSASLYSIYRISKSVTVSRIEKIYRNGSSCLRFEGELESGCYREWNADFHRMPTRQASADVPNQGFIKQQDLKDKENYIEEGL